MADNPRLRDEAREKLMTYIIGGFGLVASLAWNDAIKALIEFLFPSQANNILAKFGYALLFTLVVVVISSILVRVLRKK